MKAFSGSFEDASTVLTKNKGHLFSSFQLFPIPKQMAHNAKFLFPPKASFLVAQVKVSLMGC